MKRKVNSWKLPALAGVLSCLVAFASMGQEVEHSSLSSMSLEDLMNITVTSVSKREERAGAAAAALHVITAEDIRRSSANTLPELLRGVPGVSVAKLDSSKWAISIRGFNDRFSTKLLVLIDGRAIYTPLFSGVFWEFQDFVLEDIERIEIIRGPSATHWGSNAVNGVINITTKHAADTGSMLSVSGGTEAQFSSVLRGAGSFNPNTHYRLSLRHAAWDGGDSPEQRGVGDDWETSRASFRLDHAPVEGESLMFSADIFRTGRGEYYELGTVIPYLSDRLHFRGEEYGGHLLLDWRRAYGDDGEVQITGAYTREDSDGYTFSHASNIFNLDLRHSLNPRGRHHLMWGLGVRYHTTEVNPSRRIFTTDDDRRGLLYSAFIADEIRFFDDRLRVSPGLRLEYLDFGGDNPYQSFEVQPSLRVAWTPDETHTLWASVSRAVRVPSETEVDEQTALLSLSLPFIDAGFMGSADMDSEKVIAYEVGYRVTPNDRLSLDGTLFYHDYDDLRTLALAWPELRFEPLYPHIWVPFEARNASEGHAWGFELATDFQLTPWWRVQATYSYLQMEVETKESGIFLNEGEGAGTSPEHQVSIHSHLDLPKGFEFDSYLQYVDDLEALGVEAYWDLNLRLGWRINEHLSAELVGQHLLRPSRVEFQPSFVDTTSTGVERGVYGKVTWAF